MTTDNERLAQEIERHLRQLAPHIKDRDGPQLLERAATALRSVPAQGMVEGRSSDPEFEHYPPDTQGTWQERCSVLYQVIGCMAYMFGIFETSDDISNALDVAAGRGDVEKLLPWPKVDPRLAASQEKPE